MQWLTKVKATMPVSQAYCLLQQPDGGLVVGKPNGNGELPLPRFLLNGLCAWPMPNDKSSMHSQYAGLTHQHFAQLLDAAHRAFPGLNCIRLRVDAGYYNRLNPDQKRLYVQRLIGDCKQAADSGMYCLICCWDSLDDGAKWLERYQDSFGMFRDIHAAVLEDPILRTHVLYEPFNEPNNVRAPHWLECMKQVVIFFRQTLGYRYALFINTFFWSHGHDEEAMVALENTDRVMLANLVGRSWALLDHGICFCNHVYANHLSIFPGYRWKDQYWINANGGPQSKRAKCVTEVGFYNFVPERKSINEAWSEKSMAFFARRALNVPFYSGVIRFNGLWGDPNGLFTLDDSGGQVSFVPTQWCLIAAAAARP
ncbi:MAG TPA: hypothetical protein VNG90_04740 [Candidatus Acidoferrum sp.]|nr:hypothetical protein [Candidatus Acidoferrum sp.]